MYCFFRTGLLSCQMYQIKTSGPKLNSETVDWIRASDNNFSPRLWWKTHGETIQGFQARLKDLWENIWLGLLGQFFHMFFKIFGRNNFSMSDCLHFSCRVVSSPVLPNGFGQISHAHCRKSHLFGGKIPPFFWPKKP